MSTRERSVTQAVTVAAVAFAVLGAVAGWVWSALAHTPEYLAYRKDYAYFASESEFRYVFEVDLTYAAIAVAAGLIGGLLLGWRYWSLSWFIVAIAVVAAAGAAVIAWQLGERLGPPSLHESLSGAQRGDTFPGPVNLGTRTMLLSWPPAALVGVILGVWLRAPRDDISGGWTFDTDLTEPPRQANRQMT